MRKGFIRAELEPLCEQCVAELEAEGTLGNHASGLVRLLAQALDDAIVGHDTWLSVGLTRSRDALVLTLHQDGGAQYASAGSFSAFLSAVNDLL